MNDQSFPVTVLVKRPDGSSEAVRVGTAVRTGEGFSLSLGELSIGAVPDAAPRRAAPAQASFGGGGGGGGDVFPPYGRSRGAPIAGASVQDLEFYISGSRRTLDDPGKARWHDKERALLAVMEAELAKQRGGGSQPSYGGAPQQSYGGPDDFGGAPDFTDDDVPF